MTKAIIGSLGGNYSAEFVQFSRTLSNHEPDQAHSQLMSVLEELWGASVVLTYKGRDAIEVILRGFGIGAGDQVLTQAFTCHAIEEAIVRTGAEPMFVDLAPQGLNPTVVELDAALSRAPRAKIVLIQHTLGVPAEAQAIAKWAHRHNLYLIEDLAQAYGAILADGSPAGSQADAIVLSFGRDKIIDAVSGGAALFMTPPTASGVDLEPVPKTIIEKDLLYPSLMWSVRKHFDWGGGKVLLKIVRSLGLVQSPVASPTKGMTALPASLAQLALFQLQQVPAARAHRAQIADIYAQAFQAAFSQGVLSEDSVWVPLLEAQLRDRASLVRFPVLVPQPDELAQRLLRQNIFLTDRWYRTAVDSGSLHKRSSYQPGTCSQAEYVAAHMFNLPTHIHISPDQAKKLVKICIEELSK